MKSKINLQLFMQGVMHNDDFDQITFYRIFSLFLLNARLILNISQTELASKLGYTQKYISQVENEKQEPSAYDISRITSYLYNRINSSGQWDILEYEIMNELYEEDTY